MAKRLTDTDKWEKESFSELSLKMKLVWIYLCDKCDHAGVWEPNFKLLSFNLGETVSREEIELAFGEKIRWIGKKIFLPSFVDFQYGELNAENRVHRSVLKRLEKLQIKPLASPLLGAALGAKDKDKEKDKEKDRGGSGGRIRLADQVREDAIAVADQLKKHGNWSKAEAEVRAALGDRVYDLAIIAGPHRIRQLPDNPFYISNVMNMLKDANDQMRFKEVT